MAKTKNKRKNGKTQPIIRKQSKKDLIRRRKAYASMVDEFSSMDLSKLEELKASGEVSGGVYIIALDSAIATKKEENKIKPEKSNEKV